MATEREDKVAIEIPDPPSGLPEAVRKKWKEEYGASFKEAQADYPDDIIIQKQTALRDANKTLRTPELGSYEQCMGLEEWHFVLRQPSDDGKTLRVVTRHGKPYNFPVPRGKQNEKKEEEQAKA